MIPSVRAKGANEKMNTNQQRLGVAVGFAQDARSPRTRNTKELREVYVNQTLTRGYRAYLRRDGCEGRRFQLFIERGEEVKRLSGESETDSVRFMPTRLRKLERRGLRFAAMLDLIPSLFYSGWMLLPRRRRISSK